MFLELVAFTRLLLIVSLKDVSCCMAESIVVTMVQPHTLPIADDVRRRLERHR